jgi:hypothetical protein
MLRVGQKQLGLVQLQNYLFLPEEKYAYLYMLLYLFFMLLFCYMLSKYSILSMFLELFIHLLILQSSIPKKND